MRFGVLGPLEVLGDEGAIRLGGQKERTLLALLLTRPNRVVPVDTLVEGLWGNALPCSADKTLQSSVVRLRRALEPGRARGAPGGVLVTRDRGYLLRVEPGMLDAGRFEELAGRARELLASGNPGSAAATLAEALGLWRGRAFEEFADVGLIKAASERLEELRLGAVEDRIQAELALGRHRELIPELERLTREHPLRERFWAQLLLALYRAGRQADALLAYGRARATLVEELGIDPGAELRGLQAAILAQDPALDVPPRREPRPPPGSCRRRCWRRPASRWRVGTPSWRGCAPPGGGRWVATAAWRCSRARPGWARRGWPPSWPVRPTTTAPRCCTPDVSHVPTR